MQKILKVECYSHEEFDTLCETNGWNDSDKPDDIAFISICCTPNCAKYWLEEEDEHWFKQSEGNVLNLNFDDISCDEREWNGFVFYGMSMGQAEETVEFIQRMIDQGIRRFWIHCRAGQSRSQGVVRYISDCYKDQFEIKTRSDNPCLTPNIDVVAKLKRIWRFSTIDSLNKK